MTRNREESVVGPGSDAAAGLNHLSSWLGHHLMKIPCAKCFWLSYPMRCDDQVLFLQPRVD
jgi:hypothetical protein